MEGSASIPQLKIVLLGDEAVGKTSLLNKWTEKVFSSQVAPTIGGAAKVRRDNIDGVNYSFQIWDTAGAERYRALAPLYARDSRAALIVFDMTRRQSFENLYEWVDFLRKHGDIPFVIAGNKDDLVKEDGEHVTNEEAIEYAYQVESQFYPTSALTGSNVELAFKQVEMEAVEHYRRTGPSDNQLMVTVEETPENERPAAGGCC